MRHALVAAIRLPIGKKVGEAIGNDVRVIPGQTMKRRTTALLVGGLIALALIGLASAGPLEDGVAAYRQGDFAAAIRLLRPLADAGDAKAQFHLGRMYALGEGVGQDPGQAIAWYRKAAQHGDAEAEFVLGVMFLDRSGGPQEEALV